MLLGGQCEIRLLVLPPSVHAEYISWGTLVEGHLRYSIPCLCVRRLSLQTWPHEFRRIIIHGMTDSFIHPITAFIWYSNPIQMLLRPFSFPYLAFMVGSYARTSPSSGGTKGGIPMDSIRGSISGRNLVSIPFDRNHVRIALLTMEGDLARMFQALWILSSTLPPCIAPLRLGCVDGAPGSNVNVAETPTDRSPGENKLSLRGIGRSTVYIEIYERRPEAGLKNKDTSGTRVIVEIIGIVFRTRVFLDFRPGCVPHACVPYTLEQRSRRGSHWRQDLRHENFVPLDRYRVRYGRHVRTTNRNVSLRVRVS